MYCYSCAFWKNRTYGAVCENLHFFEEIPPMGIHKEDSLYYPYSEGGYFNTGPWFGCIHFTHKAYMEKIT